MKGCKWLIMAFILVLGSGAMAYLSAETLDTLSNDKVTLEDLIRYAYEKNPSIRTARHAWRATLENYRVVTGYPDPQLNAFYYPNPIETRLGPQDWNVSLSQKIPFPGKLSKAGEVVESEARIAHLKLDKTAREVVKSVKESYYELRYIRKAKGIADENLKLLQHLRKVGETAYARDRAALLDMVKAQSQLGQIRYDRVLLSDLEEVEITRLNTLLNRSPGVRIGPLRSTPIQSIHYNLEQLYEMAEKNQEDILVTERQIDKAEAKVDLAHLENRPDFNVGLFYGSIGKPDIPQQPRDAGRNALGIQVGVTIPIWPAKNKGRVERAFAERKMAREEKEALVSQIQKRIRSIFFRLENAKRLISLYQNDLLPQAAKAMEIAETWFRENQATFSDFIEAQAVWYNFQLALARARADYGKYLARLEPLVGQNITARKGSPGQDMKKGEK